MAIQIGEAERRVNAFVAAAKPMGIKITHQRLEIFREIASRLDHPSAEAVYRTVRARVPTVSLDTVYRTLWLLNDIGLVATLGPRRESVRFDANLSQHHHYACMICGTVRDLESKALPTPPLPDTVAGFGSVVSAHVELRGICDHCAKEQTKKPDKGTPKQRTRRNGP